VIETDWQGRCEAAEARLQELEADVEASTQVDLLERYRRGWVGVAVLGGALCNARGA